MEFPVLDPKLLDDVKHVPQGDPLLMDNLEPLKRLAPQHTKVGPSYTGSFRSVDVRHAKELTYEEFVHCYMEPNRPVLIQGAMEGWRARKEWVHEDGSPNISALEHVVGDTMVCVTDTRQQQDGCGEVKEMSLAEYLAWWRARHESQGGRGQEHSQQQQQQQQQQEEEKQSLTSQGGCKRAEYRPHYYLKDWHFCSVAPPEYRAYEVPCYFRSDWLNAYYDALGEAQKQKTQEQEASTSRGTSTADYRFVYLGPAGSWTPLHSDVLRSYSWSANVAGVKRWLLLEPEHTFLLYDRHYMRLAPDFGVDQVNRAGSCPAARGPEMQMPASAAATTASALAAQAVQQPFLEDPNLAQTFPRLQEAHPLLFECIQGPGDILFVPSGMHHTVTNLCDTLSINHNWINPFNVHWTWALLHAQRKKAETSIEDIRFLCGSNDEFQSLVDRNLKADSGMDLKGFAHFVAVAAEQHLDQLQKCSKQSSIDADETNRACAWHTFSLRRALRVLEAVAEEVQKAAAHKEASRTLAENAHRASALQMMQLQQLVQHLGSETVRDNYLDYAFSLCEFIRRLQTALALPG
uniref:JmjC domain-containing protein n=1 Tax=Dunaliella tertiolecta TaxID=3047 RepID=A0A7S3R751_DUNTE